MGVRKLGRIYFCESEWNQSGEREKCWKEQCCFPHSTPRPLWAGLGAGNGGSFAQHARLHAAACLLKARGDAPISRASARQLPHEGEAFAVLASLARYSFKLMNVVMSGGLSL